MKRCAILVYGILCYAMFLVVFLWAVGFIGNVAVPNALDSQPRIGWPVALCVNLLLLAVFSIQHSGMARPTFKRWWTRFVPRPMERSTYVLFSNVMMILMFCFWQPMGGQVWNFTGASAQVIAYSLYGLGWLVVLFSTCQLNHFELFGLRQIWLHYRGEAYTDLPFKEPSLYRFVRHPLYAGWIMVMWFTPTMTVSHLLFAIGGTAYILIAIQFEERNLVEALPGYAEYRVRVPMLVPLRRGTHRG
jgi:protein-S-isoprenylcysteine O-methyltransferase Ste14